MSTPARPAVDYATAAALTALAPGRTDIPEQAADVPEQEGVPEQAEGPRERPRPGSGLDPRGLALVKIAALVAVDAPPASCRRQVGAALDAGVTPRDIPGIPTAVAPAGRAGPAGRRGARDHGVLGLELPAAWTADRAAGEAPVSEKRRFPREAPVSGKRRSPGSGGLPGAPGGPGRRGPAHGCGGLVHSSCRRTPRSTASRREDTPSL